MTPIDSIDVFYYLSDAGWPWHRIIEWFNDPLPYLGGRSPRSVINEDPEAVMEAARRAAADW